MINYGMKTKTKRKVISNIRKFHRLLKSFNDKGTYPNFKIR